MKNLADWGGLYEAEAAVENDIARLPATTVVTIETEHGRQVAAFTDAEVLEKEEVTP
jgi:hypothetical protein